MIPTAILRNVNQGLQSCESTYVIFRRSRIIVFWLTVYISLSHSRIKAPYYTCFRIMRPITQTATGLLVYCSSFHTVSYQSQSSDNRTKNMQRRLIELEKLYEYGRWQASLSAPSRSRNLKMKYEIIVLRMHGRSGKTPTFLTEIFVVFLSPLRQIQGLRMKLGLFFPHYHSLIVPQADHNGRAV